MSRRIVDSGQGNETVFDRVNRAKHRWLKRVMFDRGTSSSEKCFAFLVVDRLNCVTQDCWPSQKLIADQFGWSIKTVHRVALALERRGYLRIIRTGFRKGDGADNAFIELLGSEKILDEKRQKRTEARSKRAAETKRAMEEAEAQQGVEHPVPGAEGEDKVKE